MDYEQARQDLVHFTPNDHDIRIERRGWVYYVRGVKRFEGLRGGGLSWDGNPLTVPLLLVLSVVLHVLGRNSDWRVGIVRLPAPNSWTVDKLRIVHRERIPSDGNLEGRLAELADEIRAGTFDPT